MSASNWVYIDVEEIIKKTDAAFLVRLEDGSQHWLPFSQIADALDYKRGDENLSMAITTWIAEQKGIS